MSISNHGWLRKLSQNVPKTSQMDCGMTQDTLTQVLTSTSNPCTKTMESPCFFKEDTTIMMTLRRSPKERRLIFPFSADQLSLGIFNVMVMLKLAKPPSITRSHSLPTTIQPEFSQLPSLHSFVLVSNYVLVFPA